MKEAVAALFEAMRDSADPATLPDEGHDPTFIDRAGPILEFLYSTYFRVSLEGIENVPLDGPALLVANHSGGLPYDGAILIYAIHRQHPTHRPLRALVANFAFEIPWMASVVARIGGVRASQDRALGLLQRGELVGVFPAGLKGVGKPFRERYRLRNFGRGGFMRVARRSGAPVLPTAIVGAEEIHPLLGKLTAIPQKLGIPYFPITPTFPLLGPLGLLPMPTKWTIRIGQPLQVPPENDQSQGTTAELAEVVRRRLDEMIAEILANRRSILFG